MSDLEKLLRQYAEKADTRWWIGPVPNGSNTQIQAEIAGKVGYPTNDFPELPLDDLVLLDRGQAASVLALAGTTCLAYGSGRAERADIEDALQALDLFGAGAIFLTNGSWCNPPSAGWMPLTDATFDCGVIGYDDRTAFIFWAEGED